MALPTIGMMTYSYHGLIREGGIDLPGIIRHCTELGVTGLDLAEALLGGPQGDIGATLEALKENGVTVHSSHSSTDLVGRGAEAKAKREVAVRGICEKLAKVGCQRLMLGSPTNDLTPEQWRPQYGIGLAEAAPIAEDYGMTVTFESRGGAMGLYVGSAAHCLEILEAAGDARVRSTFDVANFRYMGEDRDAAFDALADTISHVHLKDVVPHGDSFRMVPLGEGEVDNAPTIRKLLARGYDGCLAIECGGQGCDREDAAASVAFVRRVLAGE
jgi:sugar phosphate isomerase/epimerase